MKRLILSLTALSALSVAAPAAAQYRIDAEPVSRQDFDTRISQLEDRVRIGIRQGALSPREAANLRRDLRDLRQLEYRYSYNGLSFGERRDLQQRMRLTRDRIRLADNGRYDRDRRYGNWVDNRYYGMGGPLEDYDACADRRDGIGGVISGLFGRSCYRIGERVDRNLYAVPYEYRTRYRDNAMVYYRSDGRLIYEIDARNNVVLNSYDAD